MKSISIFFPCYNEEKNIATLVEKTIRTISQFSDNYEIIIVNDGSKDKTSIVANNLALKNKNIRVINHLKNRGYGAALKSGFSNSTKDLIFYTDGDGQFDIQEIEKLLPLIEDYDIVTGYRMNRRDNILRKLNGFLWTKLTTLVFDFKVRDVDCAFKLYRKKVFDGMELESEGAFLNTEIFAKARKNGFTIKEIGVHHYPRLAGKQTGAKLKVIIRAFYELFKFRKKIKKSF